MNTIPLPTLAFLLVLACGVAWVSRRTAPRMRLQGSVRNITSRGRLIRLLLGAALIAAGYAVAEPILVLAGGFSLYEAAARWCALNAFLGKNDCPIA